MGGQLLGAEKLDNRRELEIEKGSVQILAVLRGIPEQKLHAKHEADTADRGGEGTTAQIMDNR